MNEGLVTPDWPAPQNVIAGTTTRVIAEGILPPELRYLNQVHAAAVVTASEVRESREPLDADAVTGTVAGDHCAVRTADCLPVLFCNRDGSTVAAAHAGWRGLAAGVLENTMAALQCPAGELMAWFGPSISQPNFEVGEEVRAAFVDSDPAADGLFTPNYRGRWQADLNGLARRRLHQCGLEAIYGGHWCTVADAERFYSWRRDADTGRMVSFVLLK